MKCSKIIWMDDLSSKVYLKHGIIKGKLMLQFATFGFRNENAKKVNQCRKRRQNWTGFPI